MILGKKEDYFLVLKAPMEVIFDYCLFQICKQFIITLDFQIFKHK